MLRRARMASTIAMALTAASALAACGGGAAGGSGDTYEWDFVQFVPAEHHYTKLAQEFADDVRERTDGRLDITVRPAGELPYGADEYLARVGDGSMEMADSLSTFMAGSCRVGAMPALPMLVQGYEAFEQVWPVVEPYVQDCVEQQNARLLYHYVWPSQNIFGKGEPVDDLQDLADKTIRQTSTEHGALIEAFGAEGVTLTTEEVPPAIQRGVMDGVLTSALNVKSGHWDDFLDWGLMVEAGIAPSYINVNAAAYDELPEELRTALDEAAEAATQRNNEASMQAEEEARADLESAGMVLEQATEEQRSKMEDTMVGVWEQWAEDADGAQALEEVRAALEE